MKKIDELKQKLESLKTEGRSLNAEGKVDEAAAKLEEVRSLQKQIEIQAELDKDEERQIEKKIEKREIKKEESDAEGEYRSAFLNMVRGNDLSAEEKRSLKAGVSASGGFTVPKSFQAKLIDKLSQLNIMRSLANVIPTDSDTDIPIVASHGSAAWTAEEGAFNESDDAFGQITIKAYKLTRIIKVSEELLQDSAFDLESYLVNEFARSIAKAEEAAFINGDGVGKPTGVFTTAQIGKTAASGTAITSDEIIDTFYSLPRPYRSSAVWIMNDSTVKAIRKMKDTEGNYLWEKGLGGEPDTILGRPVHTSEFAPAIGLNAKAIAFGDMSYYTIADRKSRVFQRLNELYSANGQVGFRGYERVDGILTLPEAVQVLKMGAA